MSALLILKRSNSNVKHLVWPDACSAGHLTPGLPELPVAPDPQQQPGWTESSQTALTCGSRVTNNFLCWDISCCNYSMGRRATLRPAARPGALQRFARHQLPLCTHCLHQISPTPLPFPLSNAWSLFSTRLSKEEKKCRSAAKHWCTYRLLAHPSKPKLAELPAITARPLTNSEHQRSSVEPNKPGNFNASSRPWPCFWSAGLHLSSRLDASSATSPPPIHARPCLGQRPAPELKTRSLY